MDLAKGQWKGKGFDVFLKVGFILVKVHNPHEYVDIDICQVPCGVLVYL